MGIIKAFSGAISSTLADQWIDAFTVKPFDEYTAVMPSTLLSDSYSRGSENKKSDGVITNGSMIYVPEKTAAIITNQSGIEEVLTDAGGYQYLDGQDSIFNGGTIESAVVDQTLERFAAGGISTEQKKVLFVNLKEIRDIKFGTQGPQIYHDKSYDVDLEVRAYGNFSIRISAPDLFIKNYVPANSDYYSFEDPRAKAQLIAEILQAFISTLNKLTENYSASSLPSLAADISKAIKNNPNLACWNDRYGIQLENVTVQNIEFTEDSRELVKQYASNRMNVKAYDGVSRESADIAAQQNISQGVKEHGLGDAAGAILGVNIAQTIGGGVNGNNSELVDEQVEQLKKYKQLLDDGILTEEEFSGIKKKLLGL